MLTYKKSDAPLEIVGYSDSDFAGCLDTEKSTLEYITPHVTETLIKVIRK
jgi:hypothetical protein